MYKLDKFLERSILNVRYAIIIAVFGGILSTFMMILAGCYDVAVALIKSAQLIVNYSQLDILEKDIVTHIISAVDSYLIATVLIIFSIGLYELFISKIRYSDADQKILVVHDLDQLKEKLAKVIIIVLIVTYFKYALEADYKNMLDLFYLSGGIFLIALSIYFMRNKDHKPTNSVKDLQKD